MVSSLAFALALSTSQVVATPTLAQQLGIDIVSQTAQAASQEELKAQEEIIDMCAKLEDDKVNTYLLFPTRNIEKVYYDYVQQYEKPYEELKRILVHLADIREYVPEEYLEDIDPKNNPTNTASQVKENLSRARKIQEIAERNREARMEELAAQNMVFAGRPGGLTKQSGVYYYNGRTETYYSSKVAYHYRTSEWLLDEEGFYRTAEGYFVVAADDMPYGTVFEGSKGMCQVLDSGCGEGITDYYVSF